MLASVTMASQLLPYGTTPWQGWLLLLSKLPMGQQVQQAHRHCSFAHAQQCHAMSSV